MRLKEIVLQNFRPYRAETKIPLDDFTAIIGKNDVGKSCVLEALEIFFNSTLIKVDHDDSTKGNDAQKIVIGCVFTHLPTQLVIDQNAHTSLADEYLLNINGDLEIHRVFDCTGKKISDSVYAKAEHPSADTYEDLLLLKNADLKKRFNALAIEDETANMAVNNTLRKAIWRHCPNLQLASQMIQLDKEDAKKIWSAIEKELPIFALFQADRPSRDEDSEVQDPMKAAVIEALKNIQPLLDQVKEAVMLQTVEVANRTLEKLKEWDLALAEELSPNFKVEPKWDQIFKMMLTGDEQIPINKRGSGVRRLILLSFFRAEAEKRRAEAPKRNLIYAIEEPETSQHPSLQKVLVEVLLDLSKEHCQVFITTHNPALAAFIPIKNVRYLQKNAGTVIVREGDDDVFEEVTRTLGVLPDNRVKTLVFVEGGSDIDFLRHASRIYHSIDNTIPDLNSSDFAFIPLGGSNLQQWVDRRYLKGFGRPEVHLYDRGSNTPPEYQGAIDRILAQAQQAVLTNKREIENYYHRDAVSQVYGMAFPAFGDMDKVPEIVAKIIHENDPAANAWDTLDETVKKSKMGRVKSRMATEALNHMTHELLCAADVNQDIQGFLRIVAATL